MGKRGRNRRRHGVHKQPDRRGGSPTALQQNEAQVKLAAALAAKTDKPLSTSGPADETPQERWWRVLAERWGGLSFEQKTKLIIGGLVLTGLTVAAAVILAPLIFHSFDATHSACVSVSEVPVTPASYTARLVEGLNVAGTEQSDCLVIRSNLIAGAKYKVSRPKKGIRDLDSTDLDRETHGLHTHDGTIIVSSSLFGSPAQLQSTLQHENWHAWQSSLNRRRVGEEDARPFSDSEELFALLEVTSEDLHGSLASLISLLKSDRPLTASERRDRVDLEGFLKAHYRPKQCSITVSADEFKALGIEALLAKGQRPLIGLEVADSLGRRYPITLSVESYEQKLGRDDVACIGYAPTVEGRIDYASNLYNELATGVVYWESRAASSLSARDSEQLGTDVMELDAHIHELGHAVVAAFFPGNFHYHQDRVNRILSVPSTTPTI